MSQPAPNEYLLLARSEEWYKQLSPEQVRQLVERNNAWVARLAAAGKIKGGQALERQGTLVSGNPPRAVSDGPFVESKEAIGGYLLLQGVTYEEAVEIAKASPGLAFGGAIEVRPVAAECPVTAHARKICGELQPAVA